MAAAFSNSGSTGRIPCQGDSMSFMLFVTPGEGAVNEAYPPAETRLSLSEQSPGTALLFIEELRTVPVGLSLTEEVIRYAE
jgi:hypothetical protein